MSVNVGLRTDPETPSPTARPWTRQVFPAPSGPASARVAGEASTPTPRRSAAPSASPNRRVSSAVWVQIATEGSDSPIRPGDRYVPRSSPSFLRNGVMMSMGMGKIVVELCSVATSVSAWR